VEGKAGEIVQAGPGNQGQTIEAMLLENRADLIEA
jgi:hypothetical protein